MSENNPLTFLLLIVAACIVYGTIGGMFYSYWELFNP